MADKKISALTGATTPLAGTEVLPIVQSGATVKVSVANLTAGRAVSASSISAASATIDGVGTFGELATKIKIGTNGDSIGSDGDLYIQTTASKFLSLRTNFTEAIRLETNQNVKVTNGNLVIGTVGKGIDFSADPSAAGMTSELLDDYEEGDFTPTVTSSSGTLTTVTLGVCTYTKIGRQVTVNMQFTITNAGTGSGTLVATVPFTNGASVGNGTGRENALTGSQLQVGISATGTGASILKPDNTTIIATNAAIRASLTYFV